VATTLAGFGANTTGGNFTGDTGTWTINSNGAAYTVTPINNNVLTLTDNVGSEARSAFYDTPVPVAAFSASFVYQAAGTRAADGVAFMLQNDPRGLTALGGNGGGLGSGTANAGNPIASSAGIGLNIYAGAYSGNGLYLLQGGLVVATNSTSPVTLGSGDPIQVNVSYDGSNNLTTSMLDLSTSASFSATYPIGSLTSLVGSNAALMGFSGATGGAVSTQTISNFFYSYGFTSTAVNNVLPTTTALSVAGGATFDLVGNNQTVGSLSGAGTVTNSNPGTVSVLTTGGDNSSQTFSGSLQNGGGMLGLTKTGSGSLTLTGLNLYSGGTTVSGGTLQLGDGATFNGSLAGNIVNNSAVVFANPLNQLYSGAISGSGSLTKTGPGTLQLTGNDAYTGPTVINAGAVRLGGAFVSGFGANTTGGLQTTGVAATGRSNGTWSFNSYSYNYGFFNTPVTNNVLDLTDGTWSTASAGQYGSGEARSAFYQTPVPVNTSFRATFTYTPSYPGGSISAGTANYDNGFAFILQNQGLGALGGAGRGFGVGSDPEGAYNNYPISPSAEIEYDIFQGANAYSQPTGAATGYNTNGGTNTNISIFGGNSYVPGDPINMTVAYNAQTQVLTWSGTDAGLGLTFSESQAGVNLQSVTGGSTALIGFTGANGFDDSTQSISNFTFAAVNAGNVLPATTSLYISSNGTLDLFGSSQTVASLSGAGMVTNSNTVPSTLTVSPSSTSNFNGTLQDGAAPGGLSLVLNGPGILILSGTDSYLGGTTVEEGTLILASPTALAEGTSLTVGQGASSLFAPASAGPALAAEGVASVPEPGTLALLLAAALGSASVYRRSASKRRRSA
jgi:autotransporter-associated beta strand protein